MAKRKTLPKNFGEMLENAPLDELVAVFDACELEATGGYSKHTALGFHNCPDALARWLVGNGADVNATDTYMRTPLHHRADSWTGKVDLLLDLGAHIEARDSNGNTPLHAAAEGHKLGPVRSLIQRGADIHAENKEGQTPLGITLAVAREDDLERIAPIAEFLLSAGAKIDDNMRSDVQRIARGFEFIRAGSDPDSDYLLAAGTGLATLYRLFDVAPVVEHSIHDGRSPIVVEAGDWRSQHRRLWELLVPAGGAAATVQGEVIRISGRISHEILDNGGANWDADFRKMLDAFIAHLASGAPLPDVELSEARKLATSLRSGHGDEKQLARVCELAVDWVLANPGPTPLGATAYGR